ncbi:DNA polymerase [Candidatus Liberibacter brunswickensis]|uniref:DNA polymerase n=1 Tax=Candidatus Liberibacter brunswickensis TaxID=1968796 RepID=UPI002FE2FC6B
MSKNLFLDIETRSPLKIKNVGTYAYAEHAEILLLAYALDDQTVQCWDLTKNKNIPTDLQIALNDPDVNLIAHNSSFERVCLQHCLSVTIPLHRWKCTMVRSRFTGLPASLESVCQVLKLPEEYSKMAIEGKKLIRRYCYGELTFQPKRNEYWELFKQYCQKDVEACREIFKRLPPIPKSEESLWILDQEINDRGYCIDLELAKKADNFVVNWLYQLDQEIRDLTEGKLYSSRCVSAFLKWLLDYEHIDLPDLQEATILNILKCQYLSSRATQLLKNRLDASRSAPRKLTTLLEATSKDGRLRGTLQFYGASRTGRWAGRVFQPQNLPRPQRSNAEIEQAIDEFLYVDDVKNPIEKASDCVRSCIIAPQGKKIIVADLSGIEARVLAWVAGEQWKLDAFAQGDDIYKLAYAKAFNIPVSAVTKDQRAIGKVMELALGYQGGARAFISMAQGTGMDLKSMAEQVKLTALSDDWQQAESMALWMQEHHPNNSIDDLFIGTACELLKTAWRAKHPKVVKLWELMQNAFKEILKSDNTILRINPFLTIKKQEQNVKIELPSSRYLSYFYPQYNKELSYLSTLKAELREKTYGGKLVENIVQAVSRDILANGMWNVHLMGYDIVLSVHDELITEAPNKDRYNVSELCSLMSETPIWATGLPLKAEGYEAMRYRK